MTLIGGSGVAGMINNPNGTVARGLSRNEWVFKPRQQPK